MFEHSNGALYIGYAWATPPGGAEPVQCRCYRLEHAIRYEPVSGKPEPWERFGELALRAAMRIAVLSALREIGITKQEALALLSEVQGDGRLGDNFTDWPFQWDGDANEWKVWPLDEDGNPLPDGTVEKLASQGRMKL